jgi:hypothetical protein
LAPLSKPLSSTEKLSAKFGGRGVFPEMLFFKDPKGTPIGAGSGATRAAFIGGHYRSYMSKSFDDWANELDRRAGGAPSSIPSVPKESDTQAGIPTPVLKRDDSPMPDDLPVPTTVEKALAPFQGEAYDVKWLAVAARCSRIEIEKIFFAEKKYNEDFSTWAARQDPKFRRVIYLLFSI